MLTIAVDAMGGDNAPKAEVEGAVRAARSLGVEVILVGRKDVLQRELAQNDGSGSLPIRIEHASEQVTMEDSAARAVRTKRDSSIRVASRLVRDGVAHGLVSAGNTGAIMATAKMVQGMVPGVDRPALASAFPTMKGSPVVVMDVGANVDCSPSMLAQFALMGDIYARVIFRNPNPRVGLLSIGEEEHKGNELTRAATPLLKSLPLNFIGNVEGRDIYTGAADVIVCDGFIGNVALKVSEGLVEIIKLMLQESLAATITRKIGYVLSQGRVHRFQEARGLFGIRRRAAAGRERRLHHLPRPLERQRNQERHSRGRRVRRKPGEPPHRDRAQRMVHFPRICEGSVKAGGERIIGPPMNADERRLEMQFLSAFICVHRRLILSFLCLFVLAVPAAAQKLDPIHWEMSVEQPKVAPGGHVLARLTARIDAGWHLYAPTTPKGGPIPTTLTLAANPAVTGAEIFEPKPERRHDPNFNLDTETYENEAVFLFDVALKPDAAPGPVELSANVRYQSCNDKMCLPPVRRTAAATVTVDPGASGGMVQMLPGYRSVGAPAAPVPAKPAAGSQGTAPFLLVAFGFGLAAIFTPCVFPMIPITVSFFLAQGEKTRAQSVFQAGVFSLGIIVLFSALGLITTAILGPFGVVQLGSNPWVNGFITLVFVAFGLSLLGAFEITIPSASSRNWTARLAKAASPAR